MDEQRIQEYKNFLMSILLLAIATDHSPQSVYPLLQKNLDKLDENLEQILQLLAGEILPQLGPEEAQALAGEIFKFGNLIQHFTLGNIASNLEIAIASYEVVATVATLEAFPQDWASIQNNLGTAYYDRIKGERTDNIEQAIAHYRNALQIFTKLGFPENWARTQNNLGLAYCHRIKGERVDNLEQAIAHYRNALQIYTKSAFPQDWAMTQNNLGAAYLYRIKGDRADNIEQAIAASKNALQISTKLAFPQDWAMTQNNLGAAYLYRIKGERADNIEQAIAHYKNALKIRTNSAFLKDWATTQSNLANAYCDRINGDKTDNIEQAIAHYENALKIRTKLAFPQDWATTQNNLGNAYFDRIKGDRADNIEQAIAHYENALKIRTKSAFPQDWAMTQNNLGNAYKNRIKRERADNIEQAITAYGNALQIFTPAKFPLDCLQTARNLGNLAVENNNWQLAIEGYALAIQAVEQSRSWAIDEERRQKIIADAIGVYDRIIQAYLNLGEIEKAVEYTERSRAQRLVDMMASNELYQGGEIVPELEQHLQDYEELQRRINLLHFGCPSKAVPVLTGTPDKIMSLGMRVKQSDQSLTREALLKYETEIQALEAQKQQVWQQLRRYDPVLAGQVQVEHLDWEQIQQLIEEPTTALLSFYTTDEDTHIFILLKDRSPQVFTCVGQGGKVLQIWIGKNWFIPYDEAQSEWKQKMGDFLEELAERLQLEKLVEHYLTGIEELIIVPHILLHQIPFAALPLKRGEQEGLLAPEQDKISVSQTRGMVFSSKSSKPSATKPVTNTTYLCDRFRIRLVPSCQILHYCHQRPAIPGQEMGIVEDATEDLPFASFECKTLAEMYQVPGEQRLQGRNATVKSYQTLAQQVHILHSSHHAQSNPMEPLESQLRLGDGSLTLGQLLTPAWRMPNLSEVFASACEVNFTVTKVTDDLLSLATGFLCAGARSVVSTQWSVDDLASALLAIFYYDGRRSGMSPCQALQQGQIKLRNLTGKEFADNYQAQLTEHLEQKLKEANTAKQNAKDQGDQEELDKWVTIVDKFEIQGKRLESLSKDDFPFAHPFFWAGFVSQGI
ncbi:MAG: CHAT domain-containing protein [Moorea sp. SIOASIH]|uniref:CHAT domain-containing protein n=1 Tax=Moorena sp. SIOASIH TaxID=2607817 RepID=UPI0013B9C42F|nr:CHAT domain-containing tetratricopeptide repeat protein [Moorena sp. SIOASIH]NEO39908.1 CHAT domain-containing protein [Moorena sp. SIOASIH]